MLVLRAYLVLVLAVSVGFAQAQAPEQDCVNAIAVCQNSFSQQNSYSGAGNNATEINPNNSCLGGGELNSVWYTMTIQSDGFLNFSITPNNPLDDYDWAVYNLSNASCADIFDNPALEVSCNFSGNTGNSGITGPNGQTTGLGAAQNEPEIPVLAGETYMINVSNFSSTQSGYSLDLASSSATVFDDVQPTINSIEGVVLCGDNEITFNFSENVLCTDVNPANFSFVGPNGPHTVTAISGNSCLQGNDYEKTYTLTFDPPVSSGGNYNLIITGPVEDLCGNVANFPDSLDFDIVAIELSAESVADTCNSGVGSATVITPPGTGPYNYTWAPVGGNSAIAANLAAGTYTVTVTDQLGGCPQEIEVTVGNIPPPEAEFTVKPDNISYLDPTATFTSQSTGVSNWTWDFGDGSTFSSEENPVHEFPGPGQYVVQLIVSNDLGCSDSTTQDVSVTFLTTIYIPNAFTPAFGNGLNNQWGPIGEGISEEDYSLIVFDRWGKTVFETEDLDELWDGTFQQSNEKVPQGVYVYRLSITDLNAENQTFVGSVTVLWK